MRCGTCGAEFLATGYNLDEHLKTHEPGKKVRLIASREEWRAAHILAEGMSPWIEAVIEDERLDAVIAAALVPYLERLGYKPYADISIKLQAGVPVLVEITTKHKPTNPAP